jgi:hypothetical protein
MLEISHDFFEVVPSICPPNIYKQIEIKNGKVVQLGFAPADGIDTSLYKKYQEADAKIPEIMCVFLPMGNGRQDHLKEENKCILKCQTSHGPNLPWSFRSCHLCWKIKL